MYMKKRKGMYSTALVHLWLYHRPCEYRMQDFGTSIKRHLSHYVNLIRMGKGVQQQKIKGPCSLEGKNNVDSAREIDYDRNPIFVWSCSDANLHSIRYNVTFLPPFLVLMKSTVPDKSLGKYDLFILCGIVEEVIKNLESLSWRIIYLKNVSLGFFCFEIGF